MAEIFVIQIIKITGYFCNETKAPRFKGGWLISTISGRNLVAQSNSSANHIGAYPLILTTYLVIRHQFRFKRTVENLYNEHKLSAREIAIKLNCSHHAINEAIKKLKIKITSKVRRPKFGRSSPNKSENQLKLESKIIALLHDLKNQGKSFVDIAHSLNSRGIKTPSGHGKWRPSTVKRILNTTLQPSPQI